MTTLLHPTLNNSAAGIIDLDIKSIIKESWHKVHGFKATYWKAFFLMFVSILLLNILLVFPTMVFTWDEGEGTFTSTFFSVKNFIGIIVRELFSTSLSYIAINHIAGRTINAKMIFVFCKHFKELILPAIFIGILSFSILYLSNFIYTLFDNTGLSAENILLTIGALVFLTILGTLNAIFYMSMLVILDKKLNAWESTKIVTKIYVKNFFKLLGFGLVTALFIVCCFLLSFGIGLIWVLPMLTNIAAIFYRQVFGIEQTI